MLLAAPCTRSEKHGRSSRAVMVATVRGYDTGLEVVTSLLNSTPGYQFGGLATGNGWVHLSEFAQRWLTMREKMTSVDHPDFIHFSQFIASANDVMRSEVMDTDFRPESELIRRKVKPAWVQYFNLSKVMCGLRRLVLEANGPRVDRGFGFTHVFEDSGEQETDSLAPPSRRGYTPSRALRSLDWFLRLFPRGRIIIHLPVSLIPSTTKPPRCMCPGTGAACDAPRSVDHRARIIDQLLRYHRFRPRHTLLIAASRDFRNLTALTNKLALFLGERPTGLEQCQKVLNLWARRMEEQGMPFVQHALHSSGAVSSNDASKRRPTLSTCKRRGATIASTARCPLSRCNVTAAEASAGRAAWEPCVSCQMSLAEWAWNRPVRFSPRRRSPHQP